MLKSNFSFFYFLLSRTNKENEEQKLSVLASQESGGSIIQGGKNYGSTT